MKKILTLTVCALFAGLVAAAPAKKPAEPVVVAEKQATTEEKDCAKEATEELKVKCEAEKAAKEEEKKTK